MTGCANFDVKGVVGYGGFRFEVIATATNHRDLMVGGMDVGFHRISRYIALEFYCGM